MSILERRAVVEVKVAMLGVIQADRVEALMGDPEVRAALADVWADGYYHATNGKSGPPDAGANPFGSTSQEIQEGTP